MKTVKQKLYEVMSKENLTNLPYSCCVENEICQC